MGNGNITDKQLEILKYLESELLRKGYPPSVREICQAVRLNSTSSVHAHLNSLEKNGYIRRDPSKGRAIEILDESFQMARTESVAIPVVGRVAAGEPILAEQNIESYFSVPAEYMPASSNDVFGLRVHGDSMVNAGIFDRDLLIVEARHTAANGEIVVALVEDSATVKTFYKEDGRFRLQPENPAFEPIITDHVEILGKVRSLFRPSVF
ncbi:MAG: transcriptional repressor LexA [Lachnospiraceae bacterium]|nr:transcriptional repressor LexA [Lachnospiraceae bacterium]MBP5254303.1 transcriptional repressor LexA [Lachnospiraceae bacterium]